MKKLSINKFAPADQYPVITGCWFEENLFRNTRKAQSKHVTDVKYGPASVLMNRTIKSPKENFVLIFTSSATYTCTSYEFRVSTEERLKAWGCECLQWH